MSINEPGKIYERPWGTYQTLHINNQCQVKLLTVNPGGRLSLQKHFKRAEHWVIVQGEPTVTINDNRKNYQVNQSVFIPVEAVHRIENLTTEICQLVEVQVGNYLGEDDIERLEDIYGRMEENSSETL